MLKATPKCISHLRKKHYIVILACLPLLSLVSAQEQAGYGGFNVEVKIADIHKEIQPGNDLWFTTKILNLANKERMDITLTYEIQDSQGMSVVSSSETVAIETQASFVGKINVPEVTKTGSYRLLVILSALGEEKQAGESFSVAEEKEKEGGLIIQFSLFDITFDLEEDVIENEEELQSVVTFTSFGNIPTPVDLNFMIRDESGKDVYRETTDLTVLTEEVLRWDYDNLGTLSPGTYTAVLQTFYGDNVFDEFTQEFEVRGENTTGSRKSSDGKILKQLIAVIGGIILLGLLRVFSNGERRAIARKNK